MSDISKSDLIECARLEVDIICNLLFRDYPILKTDADGEAEETLGKPIVEDDVERESLKQELKDILADLKEFRKGL